MKFAISWPAGVTSIQDASYKTWRKQYRSSDDTTYKRVDSFRYKSNFLRKIGFTRKKAILAWANSHDGQYLPGSDYKKRKDKADRAELGTIQSWLDAAGWDENAPEVVIARQKEAAEGVVRAMRRFTKASKALATSH